MTEAEWLACTDAKRMLEFLRGKVSERKAYLLGCASCRRHLHHGYDEHGMKSVEVAEHYAERRGATAAYPDYFGIPSAPTAGDDPRHDVALLRDIFGNPWRPLLLDPALLTPTVLSLAKASYDARISPQGHLDPARLAVLADALEEVGAVEGLIAHLRSPGPHVRGCHVVDAVLSRE